MRLLRSGRSDRILKKLDPVIRREVQAALVRFLTDSGARGLNFEKLRGYDDLYSIRVNRNFRIILRRTEVDDTFEIGRASCRERV